MLSKICLSCCEQPCARRRPLPQCCIYGRRSMAGVFARQVVAAPTGSGKTGVMELAILGLLSRNISEAGEYVRQAGSLKTIYLAPSKALVQERVTDWRNRFGASLNLVCVEVTGDTQATNTNDLDAADIICTTPEKFDSLTRGGESNGNTRFFSEVALVLIDEVHLVAEKRGSALEAGAVSRIKMVSSFREMRELPISSVRFVAVSATVSNPEDVARWLNVPPQGLLVFGDEMRPVKLHTIVRGYTPTKTDFLFERRLDDYLPGILAEHSQRRPALVFCSSRKGTAETAVKLMENTSRGLPPGACGAFVYERAQLARLQEAAKLVSNKQLQQLLPSGIAFHHAALEPQDRARIEHLFLERAIMVLCTTSTLATGVNLPAHLVVLKGTRRWSGEAGEGYKEYDRSTCLQMIGRAGRPQFDTHGTAVIMTQISHVHRYQTLAAGSEVLESQLKEQLSEYLNAEIVLRTISDISMAVNWLKSTFLYVRMKAKPQHYGLPAAVQSEAAFDKLLMEKLILSTAKLLEKHDLVKTDEDEFMLHPTKAGTLMAHHYIQLQTTIQMLAVPKHASMPDLLSLLARSQEFSGIKLRRGEKKVLNAINKSVGEGRVRFCVPDPNRSQRPKERIATGPEKIFIMVNDALSNDPSDTLDFSMKQELAQVFKSGARILACMAKLYAHKECLAASANALMLQKCLRQRMWDNSRHQCRQLAGVGRQMTERLAAAGISTLRELHAADPRRIESAAQRHFPFGNQIQEELRVIMAPAVKLEITPLSWLPGGKLSLQLKVERTEEPRDADAKSFAKLVAGSIHDDKLLLCESLCLETFPSPYTVRLTTKTGPQGKEGVNIVASIIHDKMIGLDTSTKRSIATHTALKGGVPASECLPSFSAAATEQVAAPPATTAAKPTPIQPEGLTMSRSQHESLFADTGLSDCEDEQGEDEHASQRSLSDGEQNIKGQQAQQLRTPLKPSNGAGQQQQHLPGGKARARQDAENGPLLGCLTKPRVAATPKRTGSALPAAPRRKQQAVKRVTTPVQKAASALGSRDGAGTSLGTPGTFDRFRFGRPDSIAPAAGQKREPSSLSTSPMEMEQDGEAARQHPTLAIVQRKARKLMEEAGRSTSTMGQGASMGQQSSLFLSPHTTFKALSRQPLTSKSRAPSPATAPLSSSNTGSAQSSQSQPLEPRQGFWTQFQEPDTGEGLGRSSVRRGARQGAGQPAGLWGGYRDLAFRSREDLGETCAGRKPSLKTDEAGEPWGLATLLEEEEASASFGLACDQVPAAKNASAAPATNFNRLLASPHIRTAAARPAAVQSRGTDMYPATMTAGQHIPPAAKPPSSEIIDLSTPPRQHVPARAKKSLLYRLYQAEAGGFAVGNLSPARDAPSFLTTASDMLGPAPSIKSGTGSARTDPRQAEVKMQRKEFRSNEADSSENSGKDRAAGVPLVQEQPAEAVEDEYSSVFSFL
uniref:DNA 3'-5' helicase n=1 Tax=Watanabea reniformis TaxID=191674 RepID=A0A0K0MXH4_9CHLO|nr:DNA helicase [Watanabea reniformis]